MAGKYGKVAIGMLRWLNHNGIEHGPVCQPSKADPTVVVYSMKRSGIKKLPATFQGYAVRGTTRAFAYVGQGHELIDASK